jgi:CRISPR-associated protein Cmr4
VAYQPDVLRYYALALDPIHVGTGRMRLGRVDLSIVREPGTNLPKIPGTSLAGAARAYAAMQARAATAACMTAPSALPSVSLKGAGPVSRAWRSSRMRG